MTSYENSFECTRTVSRSGPPAWFAWLLLVLIVLGVAGMASVLLAADVTLSWKANTESDLAGYKIYQSTVSGKYGAPVMTVGKVTSQTLTLPQLEVDTTYFFVITAYDLALNESLKSLEVSKTIVGIPAKVPPGVPILTVIAISPTALDIRWPAVSDGAGGLAQVDIRLGSLTDHWGLMVSQICPASPCRITGLTSGTTHQVQAIAYRTEATNNIFGALSVPVTVTTTVPDLPPAQPQGLQVVSQTAEKVVIVASAQDCRRVTTSTVGSTSSQLKRTVVCVR